VVASLVHNLLAYIYPQQPIREWIRRSCLALSSQAARLIAYLEQKPSARAFDMLELQRVCVLPEDLGFFVMTCDLLLDSPVASWFQASLAVYATQPRLEYEQFCKLVYELGAPQRQQALMQAQEQFKKTTVSSWPQRLRELSETRRQEFNEQYSLPEVLTELQTTFDLKIPARYCTLAAIGGVLNHVHLRPNNVQIGVALVASYLAT